MPDAIEIQGLWKFYGNYAALKQLSLTCVEGTCHALLGRNGAGKTTLLRVLAGLSPFQRGQIRIFGAAPRASHSLRRIGFLGHGIGVYEDLSAKENLEFFGRIAAVQKRQAQIDAWLERVDLARVRDMPVRQFSRGMRQRLALARTFLNRPDVLLLDEPFTSLDDRAIALLSELLMESKNNGCTVVLSTHQLREAMQVATHVALVENGNLRFAGERTAEMLEDPSFLYRVHTRLGTD